MNSEFSKKNEEEEIPGRSDGKKRPSLVKIFLTGFLALAVFLMAGLYLLANPLLNSPFVTNKISLMLSETLHRTAVVKGIRLTGSTLAVNGLTIANPPGFATGDILSLRTVEVSPDLGKLLIGRKSFSAIRISGLKLSLARNARGVWNFADMTRLLKGKKGGGEISIGRLTIENCGISVNGRGVENISLTLGDISTKGTTGSSILLDFKDEFGSPFHMEGKGRLGENPEFDLKFTAPAFTLKSLRGLHLPIDPESGAGKLHLAAGLHGGEVKIRCEAAIERLSLKARGWESPIGCRLEFTGRYDLKGDAATLDNALLQVGEVLSLHAVGKVDGVRRERLFSFVLTSDGIDVNELFRILPGKLRGDFHADGEILPATFRISGSGAAGITSLRGGVLIRRVGLSRGRMQIVGGVRAELQLAGMKGEWAVKGRASQETAPNSPLVIIRDIPFNLKTRGGIRTMEGGIPAFSAVVAGIPARGSILYRGADAQPLSARVEFSESSFERLSRIIAVKGLELEKGTISGSLNARGGITGELRCEAKAAITGLRGRSAGSKFALDDLSAAAQAGKRGNDISASGSITARGGDFQGKKFSASLPWKLAGGVVTFRGVAGTLERAVINLRELAVPLPKFGAGTASRAIPVDLRFSGLRLLRDGNGADGVSGVFHALYDPRDGNRRLQGNGDVKAQMLLLKEKKAGSLALRLRLAGTRWTMDISGDLIDGALSASAGGGLSDSRSGADFTLDIKDMSAAVMSDFMERSYPIRVSRGKLSLSAKGEYRGGSGVTSRFAVAGGDIAAVAKNNRTMMNGGALGIAGEWGGGSLTVKEGSAGVGKAEVRFSGRLDQAASNNRHGEFSIAMPKVNVVALLDAFANVLPRAMQEAEAAGNIALDARMRINGKRTGVSGELIVDGVGVDIPSQKLSLAEINGSVPFAMELGGKGIAAPAKTGLSRENYPNLLSLQEARAKGKHNLVIGSVRFGTTEFTKTRLLITAGKGITEIKSIDSGLFGGALLGHGFISGDGGGRFGADILVHDLSLRELCNSYPAIKGYMSGRVDGFVSLYGEGKGLDSLKGFVEFWSRSANDEKMLVSKEFLQKLAGKKLKGLFFQSDRPYDRGEITAYMEEGYLTFKTLDISHTNFIGMRDLSVSVATFQNKIGLDHLLASIREAATRGKAAGGAAGAEQPPPESEFKWEQ